MPPVPRTTRPAPKVLVAHASRHGSTAQIAERIAERLSSAGLEAVAMDVGEVEAPAIYDAYVIGGAAYMFHWLKPAMRFVMQNEGLLARRPVWLFASGPIGDETIDEAGNDVLEVARPKEFDELLGLLEPREEKVFFGRWDPEAPPVGIAERMMRLVPGGRDALPAGDFRDWPAIEAWADGIAAGRGSSPPASAARPQPARGGPGSDPSVRGARRPGAGRRPRERLVRSPSDGRQGTGMRMPSRPDARPRIGLREPRVLRPCRGEAPWRRMNDLAQEVLP